MKYYPKLKQYKASNLVFDCEKEIAYSYEWYQLAKRINGIMVVNCYNYSPTTIRHMYKIYRLFDELNIEYITIEAPKGLQNIERMKEHYSKLINEIESKLANPRCAKHLKFNRQCLLNSYQQRLTYINTQMSEC